MTPEGFGYHLKRKRVEQGITKAFLARQCQTSASYIDRIERGIADPRLSLAFRLSNALGWVIR